MIRLHFVVEGQTEEIFVRDVLASHLAGFGVVSDVQRVTTSRAGGRLHRGGLLRHAHLRRDLETRMRTDSGPESWFTTLIDYYALPDDFPARDLSRAEPDPSRRAEVVEAAMLADLPHRRFVPYVQMHEFEALAFVDPEVLILDLPQRAREARQLADVASAFPTPEHIDDGVQTAPSKRIIARIPEYRGLKATVGPQVASRIGLPRLRERCPHFASWLDRLESLSAAAGTSPSAS